MRPDSAESRPPVSARDGRVLQGSGGGQPHGPGLLAKGWVTLRLREEPFLLFFALGLVFGWLGVSHWILYATGLSETYSGAGHAALQLECFELAFAAGFLFTALPKRTKSPAPSLSTIAIMALALVFTAGASLFEQPTLSSIGYLVSLAILAGFALRRLVAAGGLAERRPPATFVLVPIGLAMGFVGGVLSSNLFDTSLAVSSLGFDLVRQGVFFCLVIGVGSLILPLVFGYPPPPDLTRERRFDVVMPAVVGLMIGATIVVEHLAGVRGAATLRGILVIYGLVAFAGIHRWPTKPGLQRRFAWIAAWFVPMGPLLAGLFPDYRIALLHLTFVGGFGLLTLVVGAHVVLGHTGREALRDRAKWPVLVYGSSMIIAAVTRFSADHLLDSYFQHLAYASLVWLAGTVAWVVLLATRVPAEVPNDAVTASRPAREGA